MAEPESSMQFCFEYLRRRIKSRWKSRPGMSGVHVTFVLHPDGSRHDVRVQESSKDPQYDRQALEVLASLAPFKPLPVGFPPLPVAYLF